MYRFFRDSGNGALMILRQGKDMAEMIYIPLDNTDIDDYRNFEITDSETVKDHAKFLKSLDDREFNGEYYI